MFEFELPDLGSLMLLFTLPLAALSLFLIWPRSEAAKAHMTARWAGENLIELTPEISAAYLRAGLATSRVVGILGLAASVLVVVALATLPADTATDAIWIVAIAIGAAVTMISTWRARRPWLQPSQRRIAHLRATRLADYVPTPLRVGAWVAGASSLTAAILAWPHLEGLTRLNAAAAVMVAIAVGMAEWSGAVAAAHPQPARDAVELYAVDAWRTGNARLGLQNIALWGGACASALSHQVSPPLLGHLMLSVGAVLSLWAVLGLVWPQPVAWMRRRLWPSLGPGERVSTQAVAA